VPKIVLHDHAERELEDAIAFLEEAAAGKGLSFLDEVQTACERLLVFPKMGRSVRGDVRRWVLRQPWKYSILYSVRDYGIYVVAIAHHSRRPTYWRNRLR
jgi:plasmid stabilization system protein ParE